MIDLYPQLATAKWRSTRRTSAADGSQKDAPVPGGPIGDPLRHRLTTEPHDSRLLSPKSFWFDVGNPECHPFSEAYRSLERGVLRISTVRGLIGRFTRFQAGVGDCRPIEVAGIDDSRFWFFAHGLTANRGSASLESSSEGALRRAYVTQRNGV